MKIKDFLTEENWTWGAMARNEQGIPVTVFSDDACKFCLLGAILRCYSGKNSLYKPENVLRETICSHTRFNSISGFNDSSSFEDVQKILELADI